MSPVDKLFLHRLKTSLIMMEKLEMLPKLQERVSQKIEELKTRAEQAKGINQEHDVMLILKRNDAKMTAIGNKAIRIQNRIESAVRKMEGVRGQPPRRLSAAGEKRLNRAMNRGLKTLELAQSLLEMQLLELDSIADEIDLALGAKPRPN